jgi:hypothetical protein
MMIGVAVLHAYASLAGQDRWPFCTYPMYARNKVREDFVFLRVVGVRPDGTETPMLGNEHLRPFDQSRIAESLDKMTPPGGTSRRVQCLTDVLHRYERRRQAGRHDGPALTQVRLYRTTHTLKPWAANLHQPEQRVLLAESEWKPDPSAGVTE